MASTADIESAILQCLRNRRATTLEELVRTLPQFMWSDVFLAVDRLSREGRLSLSHPSRFEYLVSAPSVKEQAEYDKTMRHHQEG